MSDDWSMVATEVRKGMKHMRATILPEIKQMRSNPLQQNSVN
jgi:hypothetical protein